jgi:hypothetical protein
VAAAEGGAGGDAVNDPPTKIRPSGVIIEREGKSMSIYQEGNDNSNTIGTFSSDRSRITFVHGARFDRPDLLHIAMAIEPMTHPPFERGQTDAPASVAEEAHRPRIILQPGTNTLFRAIGGIVEYANPVGSIEDGFFAPAPGVTFGHRELIDVAGHLAQKAYSAKA